MAEIRMDASEWESMKENKALLEKALEREEELKSKIEDLEKQKRKELEAKNKELEALIEDRKDKVLVVNETITTEHCLVSSIYDMDSIISRITYICRDAINEVLMSTTESFMPRRYYNNESSRLKEKLQNVLDFNFTTERSSSKDTQVSYQGFDKFREEIRKVILAEEKAGLGLELKKAIDEKDKALKTLKEETDYVSSVKDRISKIESLEREAEHFFKFFINSEEFIRNYNSSNIFNRKETILNYISKHNKLKSINPFINK